MTRHRILASSCPYGEKPLKSILDPRRGIRSIGKSDAALGLIKKLEVKREIETKQEVHVKHEINFKYGRSQDEPCPSETYSTLLSLKEEYLVSSQLQQNGRILQNLRFNEIDFTEFGKSEVHEKTPFTSIHQTQGSEQNAGNCSSRGTDLERCTISWTHEIESQNQDTPDEESPVERLVSRNLRSSSRTRYGTRRN